MQAVCFILNTCFLFDNVKFCWYMLGRGYLCDQLQILGTQSLMSFPGRQHFMCVAARIKCTCDSMGEDSRKRVLNLLRTLTHMPFPFADFALHPFTVINHSLDYDNLLSCVGLWESLPNLRMALGTPDTKVCALWILSIRWTVHVYQSNTFFPCRQAKVISI